MSTLSVNQRFSAEHLNIHRHHKHVLRDVSLSLQTGEILSLLGANGAGKSTFLSALAGELGIQEAPHRCQSDEDSKHAPALILNGLGLDSMCSMQQARLRSVLPQKSGLAFDFVVSEVVAMGAYPYPELAHAEIRRLCDQAMLHADVAELTQRRYMELSGGEQQRVHYARAILQVLSGIHLAPDSRYILLDEPTSSLDPLHQHALLSSVRALARSHNLGVLVILHDVNLAALFSDRIALLSDGQVLACDCPQNVLTAENLRRVYGVDACIMAHPRHTDKPLVVFG